MTKSHPRLNDSEKEMSSRSFRDIRKISKLLYGPVRCPHCGKPAHTISVEIGGERAEVYCQRCGTFETSVQKLKLFRR